MEEGNKVLKIIYWTARILGILFILFISVFALDAFEEGVPFLQSLVGFLIHLVPTFILIAVLLLAHKKGRIGGILFNALGLFYIFMARGEHWLAYVMITGPAILTGVLFILGSVLPKRIVE